MITKGIVEDFIDIYNVKVRIPVFNKIKSDPLATPTKDLYTAAICSLANVNMNLRLGDIVYIGFEDHDVSKPVILGSIYNENGTNTLPDYKVNNLEVVGEAKLPENTSIGNITNDQLKYLTGIRTNIQQELDKILDVSVNNDGVLLFEHNSYDT